MKQLILLLPLLLVGCSQHVPKRTPPVVDTNYCLKAEQNLERLQCRDRAGDPMWVNRREERFRHTCETAQREGRIFLNPKCVANAKSCAKAKQCPPEGME